MREKRHEQHIVQLSEERTNVEAERNCLDPAAGSAHCWHLVCFGSLPQRVQHWRGEQRCDSCTTMPLRCHHSKLMERERQTWCRQRNSGMASKPNTELISPNPSGRNAKVKMPFGPPNCRSVSEFKYYQVTAASGANGVVPGAVALRYGLVVALRARRHSGPARKFLSVVR